MKKIYLLFIILTIILFGSCFEERIADKNSEIKVFAKAPMSRMSYESDNGITRVFWEKGDQIYLCTDLQRNLTYEATSDGAETGFKAWDKLDASEGDSVYAYRPYIANGPSDNFKQVLLPYLNIQQYEGQLSYDDFIYASGKIISNELDLQFKHLFSFLKITFPVNQLKDLNGIYKIKVKSSEHIAISEGIFSLDKNEMDGMFHDEIMYQIEKDSIKGEEITCYITMLPQPENTSVQIYNYTDISHSPILYSNTTPTGGFQAGKVYTLHLNKDKIEEEQLEFEAVKEQERQALIDLYNALGGDCWYHKDNWCSDKSVSEWKGVTVLDGRVTELNLNDNNCIGSIPSSIKKLEKLNTLWLRRNKIIDFTELTNLIFLERLYLDYIGFTELPEKIGNLKSLKVLSMAYNNISKLPKTISKLVKLQSIQLNNNKLTEFDSKLCLLSQLRSLNLSYNQIAGEIPPEICNMSSLASLSFDNNKLSGKIPNEIGQLENLSYLSMAKNQLSGAIPTEIGYLINMTNLQLCDNQLTGNLPEVIGNMTGLNVLALNNNDLEGTIPESFVNLTQLTGIDLSNNHLSGYISDKIVLSRFWKSITFDLNKVLEQKDGYVLTYNTQLKGEDYYDDGELKVLKTHTKGKGIKLVFMGDGYTRKLIDNGTYDQNMETAMNYFFSIEPYASFMDYFDVYSIRVVSQDDYIGRDAITGLNTGFLSDRIDGEVNFVNLYLEKHPELKENKYGVNTCVILNVKSEDIGYRSVCSRYDVGDSRNSYSFCVDNADLERIIHHETGGHGVGGLNDEYVECWGEAFLGKVDYDEDDWLGGNIDDTNDLNQIIWKDFIKDERYKNEKLGAYEGAGLYEYGLYRPTEESIMRGYGRFNAPSRWAIYRNIMRFAGEEPSWEKFLEYDAINREMIDREAESRVAPPTYNIQELTAPPITLRK